MTEPIPQASPAAAVRERRSEIDAAFDAVISSGRYILGEAVERFEHEFAAYIGARHAIGVASGTDALELALRAVGVRRGDAVLTVSHTAGATVAAIVRIGGMPVLVDVDERTYTMSPEALENAIRGLPSGLEARAVVPVHLYGGVADMSAIGSVARSAGLRVVEDCAQAHGALLGEHRVGTFGDAAAFSFYPTKNLGALGDGGAVVTDDAAVAADVRALREYGWRDRYISTAHGVNSRLDELQAAVLSVGLRHLDQDNDRRRTVAARYDAGLEGTGLALPSARVDSTHVFHQYVIRSTRRDDLRQRCDASGIGTAIHYPVPVHLQPAYQDGSVIRGDLPVTEALAGEILSLPMYPQLDVATVERVVAGCVAAVRA